MPKQAHVMPTARVWLFAVLCILCPATGLAQLSSASSSLVISTRFSALRLRGGEPDILPSAIFDTVTVGPGVKAKFIDKLLQKPGQRIPEKEKADAQTNRDYFKPPVPFDLLEGETKEEFAARLKSAFFMLEDDEFQFAFYEKFWPQYKADKRLRAARRNEELAPHLRKAFDEDEATSSSWFVPYSNLTRSELGDFPNATSFVRSKLPRSEFKNASNSPEDALWEACQRGAGDEEIFELAGDVDDIDARDPTEDEWTAAHFAAERGHVTVIEVLAALQANMWAEDLHGRTPLDVAEQYSNFQVADVLQDVFDVNAERDADRNNPPDPPECPPGASHFEKIFIY